MRICVVGSGYVGLVTGACLADFGMEVVSVDKDAGKIRRLETGDVPIYEPGLETLVARNVAERRLRFTTELGESIEQSEAVFIAVGTPPREGGGADLRYVRDVARSIGEHLNGFKAIVTKSTVPVGTGRMIEEIVAETSGSKDFAIVSNPEFLREGSAIDDFLNPDRLVIGSRSRRAVELMLDIYSPLKAKNAAFVVTDVETAEMIKYASNSFLATKVAFINEVAELCEEVGADVQEVSRGMGLDHRIGPRFLQPGPGFGGSCFPKDTRALVSMAHDAGMKFRIVEAVLESNERTKVRMIDKLEDAFGGSLTGKTVAILGLSFKPDTDDFRESAAIPILERLIAAGSEVRAYDPAAMPNARRVFPDIAYCHDAYDAAKGADALVILTEWNEFRALEFERLGEALNERLLVDLRNLYEPSKAAAAGFRYLSLGRPETGPAVDSEPTPALEEASR